MGFLAGLEHFASLYGISFAGGVAGGMLLAAFDNRRPTIDTDAN